jgi:hypothetical protein
MMQRANSNTPEPTRPGQQASKDGPRAVDAWADAEARALRYLHRSPAVGARVAREALPDTGPAYRAVANLDGAAPADAAARLLARATGHAGDGIATDAARMVTLQATDDTHYRRFNRIARTDTGEIIRPAPRIVGPMLAMRAAPVRASMPDRAHLESGRAVEGREAREVGTDPQRAVKSGALSDAALLRAFRSAVDAGCSVATLKGFALDWHARKLPPATVEPILGCIVSPKARRSARARFYKGEASAE